MLLRTINRLTKFALDSDYRERYSPFSRLNREKKRLGRIPRFTETETDMLGAPLKVIDAASFLFMYGEVFEREIYRFRAKHGSPRIIDCGANIGLSAIYFKRMYPESRVTAFEADSEVFETLKKNLASFGYNDVDCVRKAVWDSDTALEFLHEGADGGRVPKPGDRGEIVSVEAVSLRPYLKGPVDLLKLDIEGAETRVLRDCEDLLGNVENLFVEYHSFVNEPQSLNAVIEIMTGAGFRLHIHTALVSPQPFYDRVVHFGMDAQLNIFGFRER